MKIETQIKNKEHEIENLKKEIENLKNLKKELYFKNWIEFTFKSEYLGDNPDEKNIELKYGFSEDILEDLQPFLNMSFTHGVKNSENNMKFINFLMSLDENIDYIIF